MDYYELMIIGTGGRGVLLLGRLLAEAGMEKYKYALFFPNYAPAMRGGESECTIVLSDNYVNSPVMFNPDFALVMTGSALGLIQDRIKPGGYLMLDSSVMSDKVEREDINVFYIPATEKAVALGGTQAANMVLLGAYLECTKALPLNLVEKALDRRLQDESKKSILSLNKTALNEGAKLMADYKV
ncbi:MAG: 2-oxoacid:acceptor oxidoreductase family protein [Thermodesulfobacteriota bacterium]|nr:2-oxoacid:acceptor oxidoreductase family protein [Thermodesulfobacteriota bacterium]